MKLGNYSLGVGDRFGLEGVAQLEALKLAAKNGCDIQPVWNKSHREHCIVGTSPESVRDEADNAVKAGGWNAPYFVDADHICKTNVDGFIAASDFFTLDVADFIGETTDEGAIKKLQAEAQNLIGKIELPMLNSSIEISENKVSEVAAKYLAAIDHATALYEYISDKKGEGNFITEVSMDETDSPQTPEELLLILKALSVRKVPLQTIAPKFSGSFFKGVDYVGNIDAFRDEFYADLAVIKFAVEEFGLPQNLKLSVHSGSDKFSLYPIMKEAMQQFDAGLHLKTAGTTWLEELIGLALSGDNALAIAKEIYMEALSRMQELCDPYATVIDIDPAKLPGIEEVKSWSGMDYANALRHEQDCESFNPDLRQLLHVAYKVAAEMGERYLNTIKANQVTVAKNVTTNLYNRHIERLFPVIS